MTMAHGRTLDRSTTLPGFECHFAEVQSPLHCFVVVSLAPTLACESLVRQCVPWSWRWPDANLCGRRGRVCAR